MEIEPCMLVINILRVIVLLSLSFLILKKSNYWISMPTLSSNFLSRPLTLLKNSTPRLNFIDMNYLKFSM